MTNEEIIKDPSGKIIVLLHNTCFPKAEMEEENQILDELRTVISKPAILIEVEKDGSKLLYYFRSIGWNNTVLLEVHFKNERWETANCIRNPENKIIAELMKNGKQLL